MFDRLPVGACNLVIAMMAALTPRAAAQCIVQELHGDDSAQLEGYGGASSVGDVLVVGDVRGLRYPGRVWVYRRLEGQWTFEAILDDPMQDAEAVFAPAITNGEVIMVSATGVQGDGWTGVVHVYRHDGSKWNYEALLRPDDGSIVRSFGFSKALKGDVAVIGARDSMVDGFGQAGSAFVYRYDRNTKTWIREQELHAFTPAEHELFGVSAHFDGQRIIVGANGVKQIQGAAYVFRHDGGQWVGEAELMPPDGTPSDFFGWSVFIDGDFIGVGALNGPTKYGAATGAAYTFIYRDDRWFFDAKPEPENPSTTFFDWYGIPTMRTPDGRVLIVGAPGDSFGAFSAGSAYLFRELNGRWTQTGKLGDPTPNPSGQFIPTAFNGDQLMSSAFSGGVAGNGVVFIWNGIHQRDCDGDSVVDACEGVAGPYFPPTILATCEDLCDLDHNGVVNAADLAILLRAWGPCRAAECPADIHVNHRVDGIDLAVLLGAWGTIVQQDASTE